jgi:hypothetical protein
MSAVPSRLIPTLNLETPSQAALGREEIVIRVAMARPVHIAIDLVRPSRFSGTRKPSVPVRVHSVDKSFGFVA